MSRPLSSLRAAFRPYATLSPYTPPPTTPYEVFDEPSKARQRDRALIRLRSKEGGEDHSVVDYLREELAERLSERIEVCSRLKGRELQRLTRDVGLEDTSSIDTRFVLALWPPHQGSAGYNRE